MKTWICVLLLLLAPTAALAQTPPDVNNPSAVTWTPSSDHATIDGYSLDIVSPTGAVIQTLDVGKPTPDATNTCTASLNVQPVAFGNGYTIRLRARLGTVFSDPAISLNKFNRVPGPPSKASVK